MTNGLHDSVELRAMISELDGLWGEAAKIRELHQPRVREGAKIAGHDLSRMATMYGLVSHVHRTSQAVLVLVDAGHLNAAIPLVRLTFETSLTTAWLAQSEDDHGVAAILKEHTRQRRNLRENLRSSAAETFRDSVETVSDTDSSNFDHTIDQARRFDQICGDLSPGGTDAYVYYRALSAYSHPSIEITDLYLDALPDHHIPGFRSAPNDAYTDETLLYFTAVSMLWASRAFSYFTKRKDHRNSLRLLARRLGIKDDLQLSASYHQRHVKSRQKNQTAT